MSSKNVSGSFIFLKLWFLILLQFHFTKGTLPYWLIFSKLLFQLLWHKTFDFIKTCHYGTLGNSKAKFSQVSNFILHDLHNCWQASCSVDPLAVCQNRMKMMSFEVTYQEKFGFKGQFLPKFFQFHIIHFWHNHSLQ